IRRALAKDSSSRFPIAEAMANELRSVALDTSSAGTAAAVKALLRLLVLPLRMLRDDADAAFLSYGLAEAISGSLASLRDVVVRSPALTGKVSDDFDPRQLAAAADVDVLVNGSL